MRKLYIRQKVFKITDHYDILGERQEVVYRVDQDFTLIGHRVHVTHPTGAHLFTINKKVLSLLPHFTITYANGNTIELKSRFTFFRKKIDIRPSELGLHVEGSLMQHNFSLLRGNQMVGEIKKAWISWGDVYEITIYDETIQDIIVGVMLAVDHLLDQDAAAASSSSNN